MKLQLRIAAAIAAAFACFQALPAAAVNYSVKDAAGTTQTFCSYNVAGVQYTCPVIFGDNAGTPQAVQTDGSNRLKTLDTQSGTWNVGLSGAGLGTAGTPSASVLSVQGVTSMTPLKVDGSGVTQPISGSLSNISGTVSLPTGASTAALQGAQGTGSTYNPPTGGSGEIGYLSGIYAAAIDTTTPSPVKIDQTSTNNNVVVASSALPTGGATSANQSTANTSLSSIDTKLTSQATAVNQASVIGTKSAGTAATNSILNGCVYNTSLPAPTTGQQVASQCDNTGRQIIVAPTTDTKVDTLTTAVNSPTPAGTNVIGKVGIDQTTDGTTNAVHLVAGTAIAGKVGIDQTTDGTTNAVHLVAGTALVGKVGIDQTTHGTTDQVAADLTKAAGTTLLVNTGATGAGSPRVTVAVDSATVAGSATLPAGSNLVGKVGIDQTTPGTTNAITPVAATTGGLSICRVVTGTTGFCKASAGQTFRIRYQNTNAAVRYIQLYNKATAPTVGTDVPIVTVPMALTSVGDFDASGFGVAFSTGIAWAVTTDDIATPATAGTSGDLHMTLLYK